MKISKTISAVLKCEKNKQINIAVDRTKYNFFLVLQNFIIVAKNKYRSANPNIFPTKHNADERIIFEPTTKKEDIADIIVFLVRTITKTKTENVRNVVNITEDIGIDTLPETLKIFVTASVMR